MTQVTKLPINKKFALEQELYSRLQDVIHDFDGDVSVVAVIGILELLKDHIKASSL